MGTRAQRKNQLQGMVSSSRTNKPPTIKPGGHLSTHECLDGSIFLSRTILHSFYLCEGTAGGCHDVSGGGEGRAAGPHALGVDTEGICPGGGQNEEADSGREAHRLGRWDEKVYIFIWLCFFCPTETVIQVTTLHGCRCHNKRAC